MGSRHSMGARTVATAGLLAGDCAAQLWNPHGTKAIYVRSIAITNLQVPLWAGALHRSSARGTPGSTLTPGFTTHYEQRAAPASGVLIDQSIFAVNPTYADPALARFPLGLRSSALWMNFDDTHIHVPAGTGLCVVITDAVAAQVDITFAWSE